MSKTKEGGGLLASIGLTKDDVDNNDFDEDESDMNDS